MAYRVMGKWQLRWWWLMRAERKPMERGRCYKWRRGGWLLTIKQPNGGWSTIPARTRVGCYLYLWRNRTGIGYMLPA